MASLNPIAVPLNGADLSVAFAQKYLQRVKSNTASENVVDDRFIQRRREGMSEKLLGSLRSMSAKSWNKTENLLSEEIILHEIDVNLIDPWQISGGIHQVYQCAIKAYAAQLPPHTLVNQVSPVLGETRKQVTAIDPRAIGFVAMQYHYTGTQLIDLLPVGERAAFGTYVKVLDDHLYMPLQRAYRAAAQHSYDSLALQAVQKLMLHVDQIANQIVDRVIQLYPRYSCHSGFLSDANVRTSSVRDVEMFQVYMWVCLLEKNLAALQEELFPLCVMIYPRLNVSWELVRQMVGILRQEVRQCLPPEQASYCEPYYNILTRMFSVEVFPNT
jgi:Phycobilisome protein